MSGVKDSALGRAQQAGDAANFSIQRSCWIAHPNLLLKTATHMSDLKAYTRRPVLLVIITALLVVAGCHRSDAHSTIAANAFVGGSGQPMMLAAYLPWFGRPGHINVGYSSQDRV